MRNNYEGEEKTYRNNYRTSRSQFKPSQSRSSKLKQLAETLEILIDTKAEFAAQKMVDEGELLTIKSLVDAIKEEAELVLSEQKFVREKRSHSGGDL